MPGTISDRTCYAMLHHSSNIEITLFLWEYFGNILGILSHLRRQAWKLSGLVHFVHKELPDTDNNISSTSGKLISSRQECRISKFSSLDSHGTPKPVFPQHTSYNITTRNEWHERS